ncbi:chondroitin sulfate proteoglycan 4 [Brienomyrus brachyistius]|uniref:chondroitin sulfate proteoglycan 4 n=1 Tax=Brienomyrus brachyistius TaxID=42636 RepID=UPI0020B2D7AA|nr:chondroitin sulfate proteoglycan 4 [Brienomyrus brachyistius]
MRSCRLLLTALLALILVPWPSLGVSYYGNSFCRIHAVQDVSSFQLSLQFKTSQRSGLLLLAGGNRDYLAVELKEGRLRVRMDIGFGVMALFSPVGLRLNNLVEHTVKVTLQKSSLDMAINNLYNDSLSLPLIAQESLNIDYGVFLGGAGSMRAVYLDETIPPLRGCISNVVFKSHNFDILKSEPTECEETKEMCSSEFDAESGEAISFISPDSFISFPTWTLADSRLLEFLMKTTIEDALLIFHSGHQDDFIALGLVTGHLKGLVDRGSGMIVLNNTRVRLDDDQWHRIQVEINQNRFVLTVDSHSTVASLSGSEILDLTENLYVGGVPGKMKEVFRNSGLFPRMEEEITSESFIGCLGEIKTNDRERTLQHALVTKDIHVKCEGDYDYSSSYEETVTTASPIRITHPDFIPNERHCYPDDNTPEIFRNITKLLDVTPLLVPQSGEVFLDIHNLQPTFDLNKAGVRQSQIIFMLQNDPWYGIVDMNINSKRAKKFTLLDVVNKKIKYIHDSDERYGDSIQLEAFIYSSANLPECLKTSRKYVLPVKLIPVSDIPQLSNEVIAIAKYGRTRLSPNLIKIMDSDIQCEELLVTITSKTPTEEGYLENAEDPARSISQFTCRHLKDGEIYYVHKGGNVHRIGMQISNGRSTGPVTTLNLEVTQPSLTLVTNTGLLLSQGASSPIGIQQLSVSAIPRYGDVLYNITHPLKLGKLEMLTSHNAMKQVTSFRQADLEQGVLRYVSTKTEDQGEIAVERIQFDAHLGKVILPNNTFLVKIMPSQIRMAKIIPLEIKQGHTRLIKHTELEAVLKGKNMKAESMRYFIVKAPTMGTLQIHNKDLTQGSSFTQQDLRNGYLNYKVRVHRAVDVEDQFQFQVFAEEQHSPVYTYPIKILADPDIPVLTNKELRVMEGGEGILNDATLWVQAQNSTDFVYRITEDPKHGRIIRESPLGQTRFEGAIRVFSNEDLHFNRLTYKHDGSESTEDQFAFAVFKQAKRGTTTEPQEKEVLKGVVKMIIFSVNDHVPYQVVDKIFSVVRNGQRLLTTDDIQFQDDDSDFKESQLLYMRAGILSGNIVSAEDSSQSLFRFTQADLRDKKVLFVHHGADRERFQLQVSDGRHKITALLQLQASEPYLHVVNNSMAVINHGSTKTINTSMLSAESNMDIRDPSEIVYEITSPPSDGSVIVSGIEASVFTQEDLRKGVVSYQHEEQSLRSKDSFAFHVKSKGLSENGTFRIKIFKQGYFSEPKVITNEIILCYMGEHTKISEDHLKVEQADILPSEMVFTIKEPPRLGHVVMSMQNPESTVSPNMDYIHSFSQEDLNQNRVYYVSSLELGQDSFSVDVSNGFTTLDSLRVYVDIVPSEIPVQVVDLVVTEGGSTSLNDTLNISHPFYSSSNIDFIVDQTPLHGNIQLSDNFNDLSAFTWDEVRNGQVYYIHDGSETTSDRFTLLAYISETSRQSQPIDVNVTVSPVNDEPPRLIRNTGLELLPGEEAEITANMLYSEDKDTPPEELVYSIEGSSSGRVALKASLEEDIRNFTQAQIINSEVVFIHTGSQSGWFGFTVTDREHTSPLYHFIVKTRELTISMETEGELLVYPGTRQPITNDILKAVTNEDGDEITYTVIGGPNLGRLISSNDRNQFEEISSFTQSELESGSVFYEHQMPSQPFWEVQDAIRLLLSSRPAPDLQHTLPVTVSYDSEARGNVSQLWRNTGLRILQGHKDVIDTSKLDASNLLASAPESQRSSLDVVFEVKQFPIHGTLILSGQDLTREAPYFLQEDLESRELEYFHQETEASPDSFTFRVRLNPHGRGLQAQTESFIEEAFNISIKQQKLTPPKLDLILEVVQSSFAVLSDKYLSITDEDKSPEEIVFTVTKGPSNGHLMNADTRKDIKVFTQKDINERRVIFVSDGTLANGFMEFTAFDGRYKMEGLSLHIGILARTLKLAKAEEIQVKQGDDETPITESILKATTGGPNQEDVIYKITNNPKYAAVMVDRQPTSAFTQKQIKEGRVSVRFVKSTSPRDSVALVARSKAANVSTVLNITAKPLVKLLDNPVLPRGKTILVNPSVLDASALANKTRNVPNFKIIQQPHGARFVWIDGEQRQEIYNFSQKDLEEGRVGLEIRNDTRAGDQVRSNQARFLLAAHGVPPAEGTMAFRTAPYNASATYKAIVLKDPPNTVPPSPEQRGNGMSARNNLWAILIPILIVLLLVVLAAMLAYYLVRRNKTGKHNVQTVSSKPKNGEANPETFRKTDPANNIPMSNVDSKEPDPELLQHCRTTNPALKKNQYWV